MLPPRPSRPPMPPMPPFSSMPSQANDSRIAIKERELVQQLGDGVFVGNWFIFVRGTSMMAAQLSSESAVDTGTFLLEPRILFRGQAQKTQQAALTLPGVEIQPTPLPLCRLVSLTSDKALYRLNRETVHLLIAAPTQPKASKTLRLMLNSTVYGEYTLQLDDYGLYLWKIRSLPEGAYTATLVGDDEGHVDACHFEVAEYRLAPLHAELLEQQLSGDSLRYTLSVTSFDQPYRGTVEVELQERGQRVGSRVTLRCGTDGQCRSAVKLVGEGPFTLNVIASDRTATVALKGSEQQRRESVTISELGEARLLSLLPAPQSNECRGMYISRGGANTQPFLTRCLIGQEVEITARADIEYLRVVVVNPVRGTSGEKVYQHLKAEQSIRVPVPPPYGIVLLGAFIAGEAWEGWCTVLRPSELQLVCQAPKEAKPGSRVTITLTTSIKARIVPVQLIVKDQRLMTPSDPQVEFAAAIKKNIEEWQQQSHTGAVERTLASINVMMPRPVMYRASMAMSSGPFPQASIPPMAPTAVPADGRVRGAIMNAPAAFPNAPLAPTGVSSSSESLTNVRLSFPEVVYNAIVYVHGQQEVEVKLGDGMTRYTVEAVALSPDTLDWRRVETSIQATQTVFGELTVSPFVFAGDTVMGRLDIGAESGSAIVEVHHNGEALPLVDEHEATIEPGMPIPTHTIVRFPVRPGTITATVRDARKAGVDVSERYVTEPGRLRHIVRRVQLLTPGQVVTRQDVGARELRVIPGLERPFQLFVIGAVKYPHGCIEQSSTTLLAMYVGYVSNMGHAEVASEYEATLPVWYQRIKSMYLPGQGFCLYPPSEGGARQPDTHYAPLAVKRLLDLPTSATAQSTGVTQPALLSMLDDLRAMALDAANYYGITYPPQTVNDCHSAYQIVTLETTSSQQKAASVAYVRARLTQQHGQVYVPVSQQDALVPWCGVDVSTRMETAFAAACLLRNGEPADTGLALAATNYITSQLESSGRLYSTVDTAAGLALLTALRDAHIAESGEDGRVSINDMEMSLKEALTYKDDVQRVNCLEGVTAVQITSDIVEDWSTYKGQFPVEVRLERQGQVQQQFRVGDALDLVIEVPRYEPGLLAHVCLPDALSRIFGGGQIKHFTLDFCEKRLLRVPLAATGSTAGAEQHWAVIVRNMFKQEQVGNPGLLQVEVMS